jgi:UDP-N-acetylglucosamine--N-acetylmuramyl-(pentapeptide) pyrophosphoryl-undecaprenol N-acetylglucosamine transferase
MISGGGSGGHIYPALAVAERWCAREGEGWQSRLLYIGSSRGPEGAIVPRSGIAFRGIEAGQLRGVPLWRRVGGSARMFRGFWQAFQAMRRFRPDALLVTGGYVCVPVALAAWIQRRPILIYLPDLEPGLAIRALSRLAVRVAISFDVARGFFPARKVTVSGYPVRSRLLDANKDHSREALGIPQEERVLLVFGGSQGSHSINRALDDALENLLQFCWVIHISGTRDWRWLAERREGLAPRLRERYHLHDYLHEEMIEALAAADLALARAGAATLGEMPARGLPGILVPYPYAGAHQERNADYLVERGAAVKIHDRDLSGDKLLETVRSILEEGGRLAEMSKRARELSRGDAASALAQELRSIAAVEDPGGD